MMTHEREATVRVMIESKVYAPSSTVSMPFPSLVDPTTPIPTLSYMLLPPASGTTYEPHPKRV